MKYLWSGLVVFAMLISLAACRDPGRSTAAPAPTPGTVSTPMTADERDIVEKMRWVEQADPQADAAKTLASPKPELIAFAGRGLNYPGLSNEQYTEIKDKVTYRVAQGSGDVIRGKTHSGLRKKLRAYTEVYNQMIYNALK